MISLVLSMSIKATESCVHAATFVHATPVSLRTCKLSSPSKEQQVHKLYGAGLCMICAYICPLSPHSSHVHCLNPSPAWYNANHVKVKSARPTLNGCGYEGRNFGGLRTKASSFVALVTNA